MHNKEIVQKGRETIKNRYNVKNGILENPEKLEKFYQTNQKKFGTNHPIQNIKNFEQNPFWTYKKRNYKLPSGKNVKIQGYEHLALNKLLQDYKESDLAIDNKDIEKFAGKIFYEFKGKQHRYYPDIFIISENKIIEVKSDYTYKIDLEKNLAKQKACLELGLEFEFMIFTKYDNNKILKNNQD